MRCGVEVWGYAVVNERNIFLLDAAGALLSVVLLGVVVPACNQWIGMPIGTLYFLAALPVLFGLYDVACFYFADLDRPLWLRLIMGANLGYCALTIALMVAHADVLKPLGFAYFIAEQPVLIGLVAFQYRIDRRRPSRAAM